ncbi:MAG: Nramp family divalent metal transporter [Propionibacteriaceae bacterium]|nr:Nramp family divalent metal transporter [Propionibacteriaceae bacterium]
MPPTTTPRPRAMTWLWGPAFVASVAYVDPGNVAANLTSGSQFGYRLVWVLVAANLVAMLVQYLSAKLGLVTGRSLPELLGARLRRWPRWLFLAQAEIVAIATDLAEVIGGALALKILFDLPLVIGGIIVGLVSLGLLLVQSARGEKTFEHVIIALLIIIAVGFVAGLFVVHVDWLAAADGLIPSFDGRQSVLLAASMLGATVMPHAIYAHSALEIDRHGQVPDNQVRSILKGTRLETAVAMVFAGAVNIAMLVLAAAALPGVAGTDSIIGAHNAIADQLGPAVGVLFAIGLLASGLASTSVGAYAGVTIIEGLVRVKVPIVVMRLITLVPALVILGVGVDPTWALVISQVVLSVGIPFALIPLVWLGRDRLMRQFRNSMSVQVIAWLAIGGIIALNLALIWLTVSG